MFRTAGKQAFLGAVGLHFHHRGVQIDICPGCGNLRGAAFGELGPRQFFLETPQSETVVNALHENAAKVPLAVD